MEKKGKERTTIFVGVGGCLVFLQSGSSGGEEKRGRKEMERGRRKGKRPKGKEKGREAGRKVKGRNAIFVGVGAALVFLQGGLFEWRERREKRKKMERERRKGKRWKGKGIGRGKRKGKEWNTIFVGVGGALVFL